MKSDYITRQITLPITFGRRGTSSSSSLSSSSSSSFSSPSSTLHSSSSTFSSFSSSSASHLLPSPQKIPSGNIYPNSNDVRLARNEWERRKTLEIMFPPIRMNKILTAMSAAATDHDNHNNNDMGVDTTSSTPTRETSKRKRARKKEEKKKEEEEKKKKKEDGKEEEEEKCHYIALINQTNQDGMTALYLASRENALACVEILLERGQADPNIFTNTMRTPLHVAIKFQNARYVLE